MGKGTIWPASVVYETSPRAGSSKRSSSSTGMEALISRMPSSIRLLSHDTTAYAPVERCVEGDRRSQQRSIRQAAPRVPHAGSRASWLIRGGTHIPRVEVAGAIEPEAHDPGGGDADQIVGEPRAERSTTVPQSGGLAADLHHARPPGRQQVVDDERDPWVTLDVPPLLRVGQACPPMSILSVSPLFPISLAVIDD